MIATLVSISTYYLFHNKVVVGNAACQVDC